MPNDQPKRSSWAGWIAVAIVVLLVLYAASFGPAVWLVHVANVDPGGWLSTAVNYFYAPLVYAAVLSGTDWLLEEYRDLWWSLGS